MDQDQRKFKAINMRSPPGGGSPPGSLDGNGRRMQGPAGGINGIKSIHTRVAKGSQPFGKRDVFHELDTWQDRRGSIDAGGYSN